MLIMNAGRLLHQKLHVSADAKFSMLHYKIMCHIGEHGASSMKGLAAYLGITPPSATVLIARLVRSGELARVAGQSDRRSVEIVLTPAGRRHIEEARKAMAKKMNAIVGSLTPADAAKLTEILKKLLKS